MHTSENIGNNNCITDINAANRGIFWYIRGKNNRVLSSKGFRMIVIEQDCFSTFQVLSLSGPATIHEFMSGTNSGIVQPINKSTH